MACYFWTKMCDVFQLLKYFDNFYKFTSHFIKSFPENINFANTISNFLMPEECTLFQIGNRVRHGYGKTRGFSKMGSAGTGTVVDFGTPRHTVYPYRGIVG